MQVDGFLQLRRQVEPFAHGVPCEPLPETVDAVEDLGFVEPSCPSSVASCRFGSAVAAVVAV